MEQSSGISALLVSLAILALVADSTHMLAVLAIGGVFAYAFLSSR